MYGEESSGWNIYVSIADQRVSVYRDGVLEKSMVCSTGIPGTDDATPLGDYVLNESGAKRGKWFYSEKVHEGARYWVGFIGGTYLFHSIPMDKNGNVIEAEARKLGTPASHGCIRLSVDNARWFYETVPDRARVHIVKSHAPLAAAGTLTAAGCASKKEVSVWLSSHMPDYRQKYKLSCEIALTRLSLAIMGVRDVTEDSILSSIPKGTDPETSFVCDDIMAGRRNKDGSIHWNNYGTHPPVVVRSIESRLQKDGLSGVWTVRELKADDGRLRSLIANDPSFMGAIVWLVGHPERWGERPPVNERGMVLGEHVRFLEPTLDSDGAFRIRDPETGKLIVSSSSGAARDLFSYRVVALFRSASSAHSAATAATGVK